MPAGEVCRRAAGKRSKRFTEFQRKDIDNKAVTLLGCD
jgi:hypothetical protein